jgi:hypothetical protein
VRTPDSRAKTVSGSTRSSFLRRNGLAQQSDGFFRQTAPVAMCAVFKPSLQLGIDTPKQHVTHRAPPLDISDISHETNNGKACGQSQNNCQLIF